MRLTFLNAPVPLTKSYTKLPDGSVEKSSYPNVFEVSSIIEDCPDLATFGALINKHAALGNCLLKGMVMRDLKCESRKDSTDRNATTEFLCLDIDGINPEQDVPEQTLPNGMKIKGSTIKVTVDYILDSLGLGNVSYLLQWSGSMGISNNTLRCHIFLLLSKPVSAPLIKQWLIQKNHEVPVLRAHQALTKTACSLTWGLDITACQADKLIYISPPVLKGIKNPLGKLQRVQLVNRAEPSFDLTGKINSTDQNRELTDARVIELRDLEGMPKRKMTYKHVGPHEILAKPGECVVTGMKQDRGFIYFNFNGGDSWAYFHPENNPDFIFNFKGEPIYLTKELIPAYWETLNTQAYRVSSEGVIYLAFLDRRTSIYHRGEYFTDEDVLKIDIAKNETMVRQFADSKGMRLGANIPEWTMEFDPGNGVRVDFDNRVVNTFVRTEYMKAPLVRKKYNVCPPKIYSIIDHVLSHDEEAIEHFMNWLSIIAQNLSMTRTAWVLQGTQGCLAGDTELQFRRGKRNSGRVSTIKQAYQLWTGQSKGLNNRGWDPKITTYTKSVREGMTIGYHEIFKIVESGVKQLYEVTTSAGHQIRVTATHPFMRPDGSFTPLDQLRLGDEVIVEGEPLQHVANPKGRKRRHTTYSIPYHLYAWQHIIAGKNYQCSHTARLVVEADMNGLSLQEFIHVLRTDSVKSACFKYLGWDRIVHHRDDDPSNDAPSNLVVIDKANHDKHHAKDVGLGTISTKTTCIASIIKDKVEMTYDIVMKAPYHNYVANRIAVHNTGKGILFEHVLAPIFGKTQTVIKRSEELTEKWTDFVEGKFIVFIDEIETNALKNSTGVINNMKSLIANKGASIRSMHKNAFEVVNFSNWIFASNGSEPVTIPKNDRRFNVGPRQDLPFPKPTDEWIDSLKDELQGFYEYLMFYGSDATKASTPLYNDARDSLIALSMSTSESAADALKTGDLLYFVNQLPTSDAYKTDAKIMVRVDTYRRALFDILTRIKGDFCSVSRDELFILFDYSVGNMNMSPASFTKFLGHRQIEIKPVSINAKTVRGMPVTWTSTEQIPDLLKTYFSDMRTKEKT